MSNNLSEKKSKEEQFSTDSELKVFHRKWKEHQRKLNQIDTRIQYHGSKISGTNKL
jgi:hypothetical protein